ncbi:MAG: YtxH domain-containing protein [Spirochaetota bacterium]|nr:YtxH domain-containing protein [Spirochaetota bacterium]
MKHDGSGNILAFILGGIVGAGVALLLAPKSGKETRNQLRGYASNIEDKVKKQYDDIKDFTTYEVDKIKEKTKAAMEEGKKIFKKEMKEAKETD